MPVLLKDPMNSMLLLRTRNQTIMLAPVVSLAVQLISILSPSFALWSLKVPEVNSKRFYKMREEKKHSVSANNTQ